MAKEFEPGAKILRIEKNLQRPTRALKQIGILMVAESQDAFRTQRFGGRIWKPRSKVNLFGILADFDEGKKVPPARRFEQRPALRDTGRLAASIAFQIRGDVVEVGTNLPYAEKHQRGGRTESVKITSAIQRDLWKWLKNQSDELKQRLGWVLNRKFRGQKLQGSVPKRRFVGITKQTVRDVREAVGVYIGEAK